MDTVRGGWRVVDTLLKVVHKRSGHVLAVREGRTSREGSRNKGRGHVLHRLFSLSMLESTFKDPRLSWK